MQTICNLQIIVFVLFANDCNHLQIPNCLYFAKICCWLLLLVVLCCCAFARNTKQSPTTISNKLFAFFKQSTICIQYKCYCLVTSWPYTHSLESSWRRVLATLMPSWPQSLVSLSASPFLSRAPIPSCPREFAFNVNAIASCPRVIVRICTHLHPPALKYNPKTTHLTPTLTLTLTIVPCASPLSPRALMPICTHLYPPALKYNPKTTHIIKYCKFYCKLMKKLCKI